MFKDSVWERYTVQNNEGSNVEKKKNVAFPCANSPKKPRKVLRKRSLLAQLQKAMCRRRDEAVKGRGTPFLPLPPTLLYALVSLCVKGGDQN